MLFAVNVPSALRCNLIRNHHSRNHQNNKPAQWRVWFTCCRLCAK